MKYLIGLTSKFVGLLLIVSLLVAFSTYRTRLIKVVPLELSIKPAVVTIVVPEIKPVEIIIVTNRHEDFLNAIGFKESGNRYDIVNRFGYMGRYQFGKRTLRWLGFKMSKEEFLNSPRIQEEAMHTLLTANKKSLQKYIDKYGGTYHNGILVTESGLLAAAHLGGSGSVRKWFRTGKIRKDGNGVKITTYMTKFSGYKLVLP